MQDSFFEREAEWLLKEAFHNETTPAFYAAKERLAGGEPLAYLIGHIPFGPLTISLDSHPLIPRVETEFWVAELFAALRDAAPSHILDLCAGSGCIGAYALHEFPAARVDFAEIDPRHHTTIAKNTISNNLPATQTRIFGGDLFAEIPDGMRYDLILTNPPYIDEALGRTAENVHAHEPHQALYGGEDGMDVVARIIAAAPNYLTPHGTLAIEHEPEQCDALRTQAEQHGFTVTHHKDQYDVYRYSVLVVNH